MFSVTKTGMNFRPLCTANVYPTISGVMVERRDQVLMIFLSPVSTALRNFRARPSSTYGPFLMDRPTSKPLYLYFPRRLTMYLSVDGFLRVLYPFVGLPPVPHLEFDIGDERPDRDVPDRKSVPRLDVRAGARQDRVADGDPGGTEDVPFLPVRVVQQGDPRGAVRGASAGGGGARGA